MNSNPSLDQFFTKHHVSQDCVKEALSVLRYEGLRLEDLLFIEPSAGNGCFVDNLKRVKMQVAAYDIEPRRSYIKKNDFLRQAIKPATNKKDTIIIGNPPFGRAGKIALQFIIQGFEYSDYVCFILPNNFQKYSMQRLLPDSVRIICQETLPSNAFYTDQEKDIDIGCVFQILTKRKSKEKDKRIKSKPPISHPDFILYQYNNTEAALKYFEEDFDLAVFNQGYGKYPDFRTKAADCDKKKQWLLIKCRNKKILANIKRLDFAKLANKNTTVKGFRKADFVDEYLRLYG